MIIQSSRRDSIGEALQANRLPLVLIGVGVAWLVASNAGLTERVAQDQRIQTARRRIGEMAAEIGIGNGSRPRSGAGQIVRPSGEPIIHAGEAGRAEGWVHQAAGAARGAISSVRNAGSVVLDRAGSISGYAGDASRRASDQLAGRIERDPWLVGIAGFVAGALLAAVLPPTRTEKEFLSGAREELRSRAAELGHEAAERVRELADSAPRASQH